MCADLVVIPFSFSQPLQPEETNPTSVPPLFMQQTLIKVSLSWPPLRDCHQRLQDFILLDSSRRGWVRLAGREPLEVTRTLPQTHQEVDMVTIQMRRV